MRKIPKIDIIPQIIIFFAGFAFLIFEISWNRILSLYLGSTVFASTLVLAAFMGGMGLGGLFWGQRVNSQKTSKHLLSWLFATIALLGIINYYIFNSGIAGLYGLFSGWNIWFREIVIYLLAFILLIASAFLTGGILPSLAQSLINSNREVSHHIGLIYGLETLGSAVGGILTGFVFLSAFGQQNTVWMAVIIMLLLSLLSRRYITSRYDKAANQQQVQKAQKHAKKSAAEFRKPALLLTLMCGFSLIALQIVWVRILKIYLTNTSYTFSLIAALVIAGLFIGSWWYKKKTPEIKATLRKVFYLLISIAVLTIAGLLILLNLPELMLIPVHELLDTHFTRLLIIPVLVALIVILPVAAVSGYAFPFAVHLYTQSYTNVGKNTGRVMLANAAGAFTGPLLMAFALIPAVGAGRAILIIAALLLLAAYIVSKKTEQQKTVRLINAGGIIIILLIIFSNVNMYILPPSFHTKDKKVLHYNEAVQGTIVVGEVSNDKTSVKSTYVNNASVIGSSYDAIKAVKMVGHMPFFAGLKAENALIVGFGIGVTTSAIATHNEIKNIDCVELVPGLQHAAKFYKKLNNNIVSDPRLNIYGGDGRHFLQSTSKKYDFISSDPTHPVLGSGNLYTKSYFELYKNHLNPGGMVSQYLPLHKLNRDDLLGLIKTFHSVFEHSIVWLGHYHAILMGSMQPLNIDFKAWSSRIQQLPKDPYFYANPYHLAATLIFDSKAIEKFPENIKINTDDQSYVEFFDYSVFEEKNLPRNLAYLNYNRDGLFNVFHNIPDRTLMKRFIEGNQLMTRGLEGMLRNNKKVLYNQLRKASRINPQNEEYQFLLKLYFRQ